MVAAALAMFQTASTHGETWQPATGSASWSTSANWNPATVPDATGAAAIFNGAATANNPAQTGNRTATLDGMHTVGSILFNTDLSTFTNTIATGTGGPLVFDQTGAGPATIITQGSGSGNNTISVAMTLTDSLVATVSNTLASSAAGSLNLTGTMSGPGGFTKLGDGLATFGTGARTYIGATVLSGGRMRISATAAPTATSSFTVNAGAQLDTISTGTYSFGSGPLNLNGVGATSGPFAAFPGAIRPDRGLLINLTNSVILQSDTLLHMQANTGTGSTSPIGSITLAGPISGPGKLTFTAPNSDIDMGFLILSGGPSTYTGGTLVAGGILSITGAASSTGTGNVTVSNATSPL